jgi:hypothetical protein
MSFMGGSSRVEKGRRSRGGGCYCNDDAFGLACSLSRSWMAWRLGGWRLAAGAQVLAWLEAGWESKPGSTTPYS